MSSSTMEQKLLDSCAARSLGMKWYFFFVKIRPWFEIVITFLWLVTTLVDIIPYALESLNKAAIGIIIMSLAYAFILMVLQFRVFIASITDIEKLEKYIDNLLVFEICVLAYRWADAIQGIAGVISWIVVSLLGYYIWYKPNMTYFGKRLIMTYLHIPIHSTPIMRAESATQATNREVVLPHTVSSTGPTTDVPKSIPVVPTKVPTSITYEPHIHKPYNEKLIHKTLKGDYVRSKSEVIIANMLFDAGIQYEYEKELDLGEDGIRIPDFTIDLPHKGYRFFWEHCGMMNNWQYQRKWDTKKAIYRKHNIIEGQNLIVSQDLPNGGIDSAEIRRLIDTYLR